MQFKCFVKKNVLIYLLSQHHDCLSPVKVREKDISYSDIGLILLECSHCNTSRNQSRHAPSQWETSLQCNDVSHWLGAYLNWSLHQKCWSTTHIVEWFQTYLRIWLCKDRYFHWIWSSRDAGDVVTMASRCVCNGTLRFVIFITNLVRMGSVYIPSSCFSFLYFIIENKKRVT